MERGETRRIEKNKVEVHSSIKHIARKDRIQDKGKWVERVNLVMMERAKEEWKHPREVLEKTIMSINAP